MQRDLVLIIGLACSGKTTLARLAAGHEVLHADDLRYSDDKWTRRPLADFQNQVSAAVSAARKRSSKKWIIFESSLLDINDPEDARTAVLTSLLPQTAMVFIIKPDDFFACLGQLIDRSIGRVTGTEPAGSCPETSSSRAHLIHKFISGYDKACLALTTFHRIASDAGCTVYSDTRGNLTKWFLQRV